MMIVLMEVYFRINLNILVFFFGYLKFLFEKVYFFIVIGVIVDIYYCLFWEIKIILKLVYEFVFV